MAPHKTITINGRAYDAVTGLPVEGPATTPQGPAPSKKTPETPESKTAAVRAKKPAESVHSTTQRSKTLHRRAAKKPEQPAKPLRPTGGRHMDFARSSKITHFAPHPVAKPASTQPAVADTPAKQHPVVSRALAKQPTPKPTKAAKAPVKQTAAKPTTAKQVKEVAIEKALAAPKPKKNTKKSIFASKWTRRIIAVLVIAVVLGGTGFVVYRFIPSVSVGIAAAQAGIEASYPEYTPDGFSLKQPVTYSEGQVDLTFASNSNDTNYTVTQKRSSWDSSAVLDNLVKPAAGNDYSTTRERGLTIYTYENNAAWVNGGILYTIQSNAALSGEQIRRLATSL